MKTRIFTIILALFAIATTAQAAITCSKPTELTATEITANSVKLSWTENGEATAWEIQYSTDADNIDEGTTILVTENPYTLTGLTAQTTYYARVRAVCGEGDYSNWSPTATFTTEVKNLVNVTVTAKPTEGGTVTGGGDYAEGTEVTVTATPKEGYVFSYWYDGKNIIRDANHTFTITENVTLTAYFDKLVNITVTASPADGGTVTGSGIYKAGSMVPVTATANPGYVFVGWYDGDKLKSYNACYDVPVGSSDKNLTARFLRVQVNVVDEDGYPVDAGVYTVRLEVDQGFMFGYSYTGLMVRVQIDYPGSDWVITRIEGAYSSFGTNPLWTDIVDGGGNQDLYSDFGRYDFTMPDGPVTITVTLYQLLPKYFWIALNASPREGGDVFGGGNHFLPGEPAELIAFPNPGYQFVGWTENGEQVSTDNPYIFPVTGYRTLTAVFAKLYPLWIGDTQVDEANKDDIPGVTGENAKASFDPATNTLTLENVTGVTGNTMGALITAEGIDLTVEGSAVLEDKNIDMGIQVAPGSLTLDGDFTISAGSYGIYVQKDVTMVKGSLFAKGKAACGIYSARETLKVNGGTLEAMGSMCALGTVPDFSGYTGEYEVLVNENYNAEGASQWSGDDVNDPLGGFSSSYKYVKIIPIITPTLVLLDDDSEADSKNQELIQANLGEQVGKVNVMLEGRTIYRDGRWNTICLPFNLEDGDDSDGKNCTGTLFEGAIVKRFDSSSYTPETKTLTLSFEDSESIWTGGPYLVRWDSSENLEDLVNPVFKNVEIIDGEPLPDTSDCIDFLGTFSPVTLAAQDRTVLYLGGDSKLYYPGVDVPVNAFRGYFQLKNGLTAGDLPTNGAKNFVLNFGDSTTEIVNYQLSTINSNDGWYSIDGRKLSGEPTQKGIYIWNGKKIVK